MQLKQLTLSRFEKPIGSLSNFIGRVCPNLEKFCWEEMHVLMTNEMAKRRVEETSLFFELVPKLRKTVYWYWNDQKPGGTQGLPCAEMMMNKLKL